MRFITLDMDPTVRVRMQQYMQPFSSQKVPGLDVPLDTEGKLPKLKVFLLVAWLSP